MITSGRDWWDILRRRRMHRRRGEVAALLGRGSGIWRRSLRSAKQERGTIRVKPGDFTPVVHSVALGKPQPN